jgi:hypothetical protein
MKHSRLGARKGADRPVRAIPLELGLMKELFLLKGVFIVSKTNQNPGKTSGIARLKRNT